MFFQFGLDKLEPKGSDVEMQRFKDELAEQRRKEDYVHYLNQQLSLEEKRRFRQDATR